MDEFLDLLAAIHGEEDLLDFCRRRNLHGTPFVFEGNEDAYYSFRDRIAKNFDISFIDVYVTGSAKLGFSPHKEKPFDLDSDIDVAIISSDLYEKFMMEIHGFQMELRQNRRAISERELGRYHDFLEYGAIGWMRPDLLPTAFRIQTLKDEWFNFFKSISYGASEVGDYKVSAGAFKSYKHLELYSLSGLRSLRNKLQIRNIHA